MQTIASFLLPRRIHLPRPEERLVEVAPGGVDPAVKIRCWCYWQGEEKKDRVKPLTLIVVHGLEGFEDEALDVAVAEAELGILDVGDEDPTAS